MHRTYLISERSDGWVAPASFGVDQSLVFTTAENIHSG
ncbi:hypothetical protein BSU04_20690 [Caballeronia sordidicola]|uniref:Uncharacterized protein n=1 Tax=Caballeronia sordidicola TaxID=196367 RepID=A0A226WZP0_CABSO|nr:hypothetical protein BSU04_20690 [Caballeronia sordidicola]